MKIVEFDALSAAEEIWDAYFRHMDEIMQEVNPDDPLLPREKRKALIISSYSNPYMKLYMFLLFPDDGFRDVTGRAAVFVETPHSPSYETNKHAADLNLSVSPECRRKGLGSLLLKRVAEELAAKEPVVSELRIAVVLESGKSFLDRLGGTVALENSENRLYLKDVAWGMVEDWAAEGARKNPCTSIKMVQSIPQEDIEEYSAVYTETANQQPFGDVPMDVKCTPEQIRFIERENLQQGVTHTTMYSKESDGRISGLTEMRYLKEAGHKASQNLTGVRAQYRGRGLGKLLKAGMLLYIRKAYPGVKYVVTGNADSNASMLGINLKLGFKKHLSRKIYKLKLPLKS
jgi:ribosomal protein S18 acetylase RimI-like enzyme